MSHPGRERGENEDAFGCFPAARLFVVADGMGGHNAGEVASAQAVSAIEQFFRSFHADPRQPWPHPVDRTLSLGANLLRCAIKVANDAIRAEAATDRSRARMGATVVAMAIGEEQLAVAHAGDSRAYRLRGGTLTRLTRDHSIAEEMRLARPELTDAELADHPHRNVVTPQPGKQGRRRPRHSRLEREARRSQPLCSDGLWGSVADGDMADILRDSSDLEAACRLLVDAANAAGGPVNITALLVRVG